MVSMLAVTSMLGLLGAHLRAVPRKYACTGGCIRGVLCKVNQVTVTVPLLQHTLRNALETTSCLLLGSAADLPIVGMEWVPVPPYAELVASAI